MHDQQIACTVLEGTCVEVWQRDWFTCNKSSYFQCLYALTKWN